MEPTNPDFEEDPVLTPAQMRFARLHRARPGCSGVHAGSVFFYHDDILGTERWLVGGCGEVLDVTYFARDAGNAARNGAPEHHEGGADTR